MIARLVTVVGDEKVFYDVKEVAFVNHETYGAQPVRREGGAAAPWNDTLIINVNGIVAVAFSDDGGQPTPRALAAGGVKTSL